MTNFAEVWSRKSDEQVQDAARHILEYAEEAQAVILSEAWQRGLTVDQTITVTASSLTFVDCYLRGWKRSFALGGRAGRKECFTFLVVNHVILMGGLLMAVSFGWRSNAFALLVLMFFLAIQVPHRTLIVRRIHDTGRVGWWGLLAVIPFVGGVALLGLLTKDGEVGPNRWGDPT